MKLTRYIKTAKAATSWDLGNESLYQLCRRNPLHKSNDEIISKVWLIGRSYSAAIERRRAGIYTGKNFYADRVAPQISASQIDEWIANAKKTPTIETMIDAHFNVTKLFGEISGLDKRSLASKYLHFHLPSIFYIYDSQAANGISLLSKFTGRASRTKGHGDNNYRKFVEKCATLRKHLREHYEEDLTPRQIDKLLLAVHGAET